MSVLADLCGLHRTGFVPLALVGGWREKAVGRRDRVDAAMLTMYSSSRGVLLAHFCARGISNFVPKVDIEPVVND